jgi:hypothetical protein
MGCEVKLGKRFVFASVSCGPSKFCGHQQACDSLSTFNIPTPTSPHLTTRSTFTLDHARIGHPRQHPPPFSLAKAHSGARYTPLHTHSHTTSHQQPLLNRRIPTKCLAEAFVEDVVVDAAGSARPRASTLAQCHSTSTRSLRKSSRSRRRTRTTSFR